MKDLIAIANGNFFFLIKPESIFVGDVPCFKVLKQLTPDGQQIDSLVEYLPTAQVIGYTTLNNSILKRDILSKQPKEETKESSLLTL